MTNSSYLDFVQKRTHDGCDFGFGPKALNHHLMDFQAELVEWACQKGRAAIFADCGMGKTLMQLAWADQVVRKTNGSVLVLAPLAVAGQTISEGAKFGIEVSRPPAKGPSIVVTNYERLHHVDPSDYVGCVCDESSILKSFDGKTRRAVTDFMRKLPYRLLCTATAAPNDFIELGTSSEALGYLGHMDMLNKFFTNKQKNSYTGRAWAGRGGEESFKWRFKGHAEQSFWRWVCSWARAIRHPSDYGYSDERFVLPALVEREHVVQSSRPRDGWLFAEAARGLREQREERRRTLPERCERAAELLSDDDAAIAWCYLNDESDLMERLIPGASQVSGRDPDEAKVEKFDAFASGEIRALVIKPVIGAWGLNWQHCAHMSMFAGYSFEQYYQSVRRCWRFGQQRPVVVEHVISDGEGAVLDTRKRKAKSADEMFANLVAYMKNEMHVEGPSGPTERERVPEWL